MKTLNIIVIVILNFLVLPMARSYTMHDPIHTVLNIGQQLIGQVRQQAQHAAPNAHGDPKHERGQR